MRKLSLLVVLALFASLLAVAEQDSHNVVITLNGVYWIEVTRPGYPDEDVHILADPLGVVRDSTSRLSYFLNKLGPLGTRLTVISSWSPGYPMWWACYLNLSWNITQPKGHVLVSDHIFLAQNWVQPEIFLVINDLMGPADLGEFLEALVLEYEVTVTDKSVKAGTSTKGTVIYTIEDQP